MALYNWLLMLSHVLSNELTEINAYHYARAHTYTHKYTHLQMQLCCFTAICVICVSSFLQFIFCKRDIFVIRLAVWGFTPSLRAERQQKVFQASTFLTTRGSWTLAFIHIRPLRGSEMFELPWVQVHWPDWLDCLSVLLSLIQTVVLLRYLALT